MRNAWLRTFAALFCIAGFTATTAVADPAGMATRTRQMSSPGTPTSLWPWSKETATHAPAPQAQYGQPRPTDSISAKEHPIKYLKAAVSEMPIGKNKKGDSAPRSTMPPAGQKVDSISLSQPTGPPSPEFFIYAAQICEQQHDVAQARINLQRALTMWPGQVEVLRSAARMEDRQGNLLLAENLYQQAVTANPQHAGALNDLGLCLARQGKLEPSAQVLEQAVQLQPAKALYRNNAATVLVEMHQDQRALGHLAAVHGPAEANYNLGQLLVERNRAADAAPYFQAALQQNPNMQPAAEALARLQGSHLAISTPPAAARPTTPVAVVPAAPQMAQQQPIAQQPVAQQPIAPQQTMAPAPQQYGYPMTAQAPMATAPNYGTPQYLPPVAARPGAVRR